MGAHRTTECQRCEWTFRGSKRDGDHAYGVHLVEEHPQSIQPEPTPEVIEKVAQYAKSDLTLGHLCPSAQSITPLEDGWCPWCGRQPKPVYEWFVPALASVRPFWRRIEVAA